MEPKGSKTAFKPLPPTSYSNDRPSDNHFHVTKAPRHTTSHTTIRSTWDLMNRTLEKFATKTSESSERRGDNTSRKTFEKTERMKELKDDSDGCIDTWVEETKLHLEQDNLNDDREACTAFLSNLEGTALKCVVPKK